MRRRDKEITDIGQMEEILGRAEVCRFALSVDDAPYIVPVNFAYDRRRIYVHSAPEGRKIGMIRKNGRVCFEVDIDAEVLRGETPCKWGARYRSVIGSGTALLVDDPRERLAALDLIVRKYTGAPGITYPGALLNAVTIIRIDIVEMTGKRSGY